MFGKASFSVVFICFNFIIPFIQFFYVFLGNFVPYNFDSYIHLSILPKIIFYFYLRCYDHNILRLINFPTTMTMFGCLLLISLICLKLQYKYGNKLFCMKDKNCKRHCYFVRVDQEKLVNHSNNVSKVMDQSNLTNTEKLICSICFNELDSFVESSFDIQFEDTYIRDKIKDRDYIMKTPCRHLFHSICLIEWMERKAECPNCRTILPQVSDFN